MQSREKFKIYNNVFDEFTNKTIQKLSRQGYFAELTTSLALGKEANIFLGKKDDETYVIVKIYRLQNCNFNKMFSYIKSDPRFADLKGRRREIIFKWVQREYRNLHLAREAGARVPTPYTFSNNVIVMELIGSHDEVASQIKDCEIADPKSLIDDIVTQMKIMYQEAGIVHGDLSKFNILYFKEKPYIIDMSQSTAKEDLNANEYLDRDLTNIASFAKRLGVDFDIPSLKKKIIGK